MDDAMAATRQRRQCARHTPATGGAEIESLSQSRELVQPPESPPQKQKIVPNNVLNLKTPFITLHFWICIFKYTL